MRAVALAVAIAGVPLLAAAAPASDVRLDGNVLLARAAQLNRWPGAYTVPLRFHVHLHRPVSIRFGANATTYFQAPDKQALTITSLPRMIGRLFSRNYAQLDTVPTAWPAKYRVTSVMRGEQNGVPAYHLDALPTYTGDISHVTFDLLATGLTPVGVTWFYHDGSSVRLRVTNERIGGYVLPQHEELAIAMPRYVLEATADVGPYAIGAPIPDGVFDQR